MSSSSHRFFHPFSKKLSLPVATLISPEEDAFLAVQFGQRSLGKRKENKKALLHELGIDKKDYAKPLLIVLLSLFQDKAEQNLLGNILTGLKCLDLTVVVLGPKEACASALLDRYYHQDPTEKHLHQALAAGDMLILPPQSDGTLNKACLDYGIVPIVSSNQATMIDYDPTLETGNAFVYKTTSSWAMFAAIVRALETFKLPYDWQRIQRNGMEK